MRIELESEEEDEQMRALETVFEMLGILHDIGHSIAKGMKYVGKYKLLCWRYK